MHKFILKLKDVTAKSDTDLCQTCTYLSYRTEEDGTVVRQCGEFYEVRANLPRKVVDCNCYYPANLPSLRAMAEIAWEIKTSKDGKKIGFTAPSRKNEDRETIPALPFGE